MISVAPNDAGPKGCFFVVADANPISRLRIEQIIARPRPVAYPALHDQIAPDAVGVIPKVVAVVTHGYKVTYASGPCHAGFAIGPSKTCRTAAKCSAVAAARPTVQWG